MRPREHAGLLADYNAWMNQRLYAHAADLDDADYRRDLGAFFGSVHRTLNHILWADRLFYGRLNGQRPAVEGPADIIHDALLALTTAREAMDRSIVEWARALPDDAYDADFEWHGGQRVPVFAVVTQWFNHQTHHRGQITAMLTRLGVEVGSTDIPACPAFEALKRA